MIKPKLLDQVRDAIRVKHYSLRTEKTYIHWIKRYIFFHDKRHPAEMGEDEIRRFLTHLAVNRDVTAATQNQALSAILFLYKDVLHKELDWIDGIERAKKPARLPVVLTREEVRAILSQLEGTRWLMASLLYGTGIRLMECLRLRAKDIDFDYRQITVRDGKGGKDRVTMLPQALVEPIKNHLTKVRALHAKDLQEGFGEVYLPHALAKKYPNAGREWGWQYVFPASKRGVDPYSGKIRRHHLDPKVLQRVVSLAVRNVGLAKPASCHTLRHSLDSPHPCGSPFGRAKARQILFQTKFCHASARRRLRYSDRPGTAWPLGCQHDHDLHARTQQGRERRTQSLDSLVSVGAPADLSPPG